MRMGDAAGSSFGTEELADICHEAKCIRERIYFVLCCFFSHRVVSKTTYVFEIGYLFNVTC